MINNKTLLCIVYYIVLTYQTTLVYFIG